MCNMCFMPSSGISARIFSKWLELPTLNDVNDLIETGFVQSSLRHTISLHPNDSGNCSFRDRTFCYKLPHVIGFSAKNMFVCMALKLAIIKNYFKQ